METKNKEIKEATARANDASISTKQSIDICKFLKGKTIGQALKELEEVKAYERAIPSTREMPHRKGLGMAGGRYHIKASDVFITLLKSLEANASAKGIDVEKAKISAKADKASRPHKSGKYSGRRFKRTHILVKLQ